MSALAVVLIVVAVLFAVLFALGYAASRRRVERQDFAGDVAAADRALEEARAADRGWNRQLLDEAARRALGVERPAFDWESLELVLVDDRPGVHEDRAHLMAVGPEDRVRVVLARDPDGRWVAERIE
jgi:type II secretory pathway pseudopilin PulG